MTSSLPQRIGKVQGKPIDSDFPATARTALSYVLKDLDQRFYLVSRDAVILELNRIGRITRDDVEGQGIRDFLEEVRVRLHLLTWYQVYLFCERVYAKLLSEFTEEYRVVVTLAEVRQYFTDEINQIVHEENLAFHFVDGQFSRRGRAQTQRAIERAGVVLSDPRFETVRKFYNKARQSFDRRPDPDNENCVKDALCALEACIEVLTSRNASRDFEKTVRQLQGNQSDQIPVPVGESMIKIHGYRGSGQGVSHAAIQGNRVSQTEAELVLSLTASYITYLIDLFPQKEEIPF